MRIILLFDLPMESSKEIREYNKFRKFLTKNGFIMYQYSVYIKLTQNHSVMNYYIDLVKKNIPSKGSISIMTMTEKQYSDIQVLSGSLNEKVEDSVERMVIL